MKTFIDANNAFYDRLLASNGLSPVSVGYNDDGTHDERVNSVLRAIGPLERETVFDVGCGLGHLGHALKARFPGVRYSGCDVFAPFAAQCRTAFPDGDFRHGGLEEIEPVVADYYTAVGIFNGPFGIDTVQWLEHVKRSLDIMFARAARGVVVNFLSDSAQKERRSDQLHYQNAGAIFDHAATRLSRFSAIDATAPLYEFTLTILKPEYALGRHGVAFSKYAGTDAP